MTAPKLTTIALILFLLAPAIPAGAASIVPGSSAADANSDLAYPIVAPGAVRSQQWIRYDQFSGPGYIISGVSFRSDIGLGGAFSVTDNLTIKLGIASGDNTTLSSLFDNNFNGVPITVFNGNTTLNFTHTASGAQQFSNSIAFTTPFVYIPQAGSNLIVDITNNGASLVTPLEGQTNCLGATPSGCNLDAVMYDAMAGAAMTRIRNNPGQSVTTASLASVSPVKGLIMQFDVTAIPEPSSIALSGLGMIALGFVRRRSVQRQRS